MSPFFFRKGVVKFGVDFGELFRVPRYLGFGCPKRSFTKLHANNGARNGTFHANFTLLGGGAEFCNAKAKTRSDDLWMVQDDWCPIPSVAARLWGYLQHPLLRRCGEASWVRRNNATQRQGAWDTQSWLIHCHNCYLAIPSFQKQKETLVQRTLGKNWSDVKMWLLDSSAAQQTDCKQELEIFLVKNSTRWEIWGRHTWTSILRWIVRTASSPKYQWVSQQRHLLFASSFSNWSVFSWPCPCLAQAMNSALLVI